LCECRKVQRRNGSPIGDTGFSKQSCFGIRQTDEIMIKGSMFLWDLLLIKNEQSLSHKLIKVCYA
jgi:hypothetical protein